MKIIIKPIFALSSLAIAMQVGAAGFALNETSASSAGTAYAGRGSNAEDASIMASNPAGIALLDQMEVTGGIGVVVPNGEFNGTGSFAGNPVAGKTSTDEFLKTAFIPFGYFSMPIDDRFSFGLGMYAPFGAESNYPDDWTGRYLADQTVVKVINVQPTVSYKFTDQLSVGLGVFGSYADGKLTRSVPPQILGQPAEAGDFYSNMEGDGWGFGWTVGAIWQPIETTTLGVSYRSHVEHTLKGDAKINNVGTGALAAEEKAKLDITLPESVNFSLTHQIDDRWTAMFGTTWTRWSRFKELKIASDQGGNGPISTPDDRNVLTYVPENWKDVWSFAVGASYKYSDQLTLKAGYAFDQSPVKDEYRTARIPDSNRNWLTVGAKYTFAKDWTVDAAYGYMIAAKANINEVAHNSAGDANPAISLTGDYKLRAHVFSASLTKRF